jgi:hypothetical protein
MFACLAYPARTIVSGFSSAGEKSLMAITSINSLFLNRSSPRALGLEQGLASVIYHFIDQQNIAFCRLKF